MEPSARLYPVLRRSAFILVGLAIFLWYFDASARYPYYANWDMDHIGTLDMLLIQSGQHPDHINHPSFGAYLILTFTQKIGYWLHALSILSLEDLKQALNPLGAVAESTQFIRAHSPWIALGITGFLWAGVCTLFDCSPLASLALLVFFGISGSLTYQATMFRSELYSVFFWSVAFFFGSLAVRAKWDTGKSLLLGLTGALVGLTYLTKIQAVFHVTALMILMLALEFLGAVKPDAKKILPQWGKASFWISLGNLVFFLLLLNVSYRIEIPSGFATFASAEDYRLTTICKLHVLILFLVTLGQSKPLAARLPVQALLGLRWVTAILTGFHLSFLLHFLIYSDYKASYRYMLYDFKILFIRRTWMDTKSWWDYWNRFKAGWGELWAVILPCFFLIGAMIVGRRARLLKIPYALSAACGLLFFLALVDMVFGARLGTGFKDPIWPEQLFKMLAAVFFFLCATHLQKDRLKGLARSFALATCAALGLAWLASSSINAGAYRVLTDASGSDYGWRPDYWLKNVYDGNQVAYLKVLDERYPPKGNALRKRVLKQTEHQATDRRRAAFPFPDLEIDHSNSGPLEVGLPVLKNELDRKVVEISPELKGAWVVGTAAAPAGPIGTYLKEIRGSTGQFAILPRADLRVLLFTSEAAPYAPPGCRTQPYSGKIKAGDDKTYTAIEIVWPCLVTRSELAGAFFVIVQR